MGAVFASVDYWAVFIAAIIAFALGAVWYRLFSSLWLAANNMTAEAVHADPSARSPMPFVVAFVADLVMAFVLFGVIWHAASAHFSIKGGIITGVLSWLGFVITTMAANNVFSRRKPILLAIDGGYWLLVLVVMGAIIGGLGPT